MTFSASAERVSLLRKEVKSLNKNNVLAALGQLKDSKARKFTQSVELIINFTGLNVQKADSQVDLKITLPHSAGKSIGKALLFAKTPELVSGVKDVFAKIILEEDISKIKKDQIAEILAFDVLLAEGPVMLSVAKFLGQDLGPKGKMPRPLIDIEPAKVKSILGSMASATRVTNKRGKGIPMIQIVIGNEKMPEDHLADNVMAVYSEVVKALPRQTQNVKSVYVKKTMSPVIRVGE